MDGQRHRAELDIFIHDDDSDDGVTVELSVPVGPTSRRFLQFEAVDRDEAEGLAQELRRLARRPCSGDSIDAVLGVRLLDEEV